MRAQVLERPECHIDAHHAIIGDVYRLQLTDLVHGDIESTRAAPQPGVARLGGRLRGRQAMHCVDCRWRPQI
jgi:hypothetical protein